MAIAGLYDITCSLYTISTTKNSIGELAETLTSVATSVPCRVRRINGNEQIFGDNTSTRIDARIYLDINANFDEWDYILAEGLYYKVVSKYQVSDRDSYHHLECDCYIDRQL